ncbi:MAG: hypothetical protein XE08_0200 [Parcubacteria bacterium 32_520]|nr:MAG: hypothetical protein XE08_0200 [Parcubacteria bacterium 32_520]
MTNKDEKLRKRDWKQLEHELTDNIIFIYDLIQNFYGDEKEIKNLCFHTGSKYLYVKKEQLIVFKILFELLTKEVLKEL